MRFEEVKQKVKNHINDHPVLYSVGVAGITLLVTRSIAARGGAGEGFNARGGLTNTVSHIC